VVLGAASDAATHAETLRLINHGYAAFDTVQVYRRGDVLATPRHMERRSRRRVRSALTTTCTLPFPRANCEPSERSR
jgi:D-alanyl-D-alanine carboxypeptidase